MKRSQKITKALISPTPSPAGSPMKRLMELRAAAVTAAAAVGGEEAILEGEENEKSFMTPVASPTNSPYKKARFTPPTEVRLKNQRLPAVLGFEAVRLDDHAMVTTNASLNQFWDGWSIEDELIAGDHLNLISPKFQQSFVGLFKAKWNVPVDLPDLQHCCRWLYCQLWNGLTSPIEQESDEFQSFYMVIMVHLFMSSTIFVKVIHPDPLFLMESYDYRNFFVRWSHVEKPYVRVKGWFLSHCDRVLMILPALSSSQGGMIETPTFTQPLLPEMVSLFKEIPEIAPIMSSKGLFSFPEMNYVLMVQKGVMDWAKNYGIPLQTVDFNEMWDSWIFNGYLYLQQRWKIQRAISVLVAGVIWAYGKDGLKALESRAEYEKSPAAFYYTLYQFYSYVKLIPQTWFTESSSSSSSSEPQRQSVSSQRLEFGSVA